jgi:hypothetical protein
LTRASILFPKSWIAGSSPAMTAVFFACSELNFRQGKALMHESGCVVSPERNSVTSPL